MVAAADHLRNADALQRLDGTGLHRHDLCPLALPALPIGIPSPGDHILRRDCHCVLSPERYMLIRLREHRNGIAVGESAGAMLMTCSSYMGRWSTNMTSARSPCPHCPWDSLLGESHPFRRDCHYVLSPLNYAIVRCTILATVASAVVVLNVCKPMTIPALKAVKAPLFRATQLSVLSTIFLRWLTHALHHKLLPFFSHFCHLSWLIIGLYIICD